MAASQLMTSKQSRKDAIATLKAESANAAVVDGTDETKERGNVWRAPRIQSLGPCDTHLSTSVCYLTG